MHLHAEILCAKNIYATYTLKLKKGQNVLPLTEQNNLNNDKRFSDKHVLFYSELLQKHYCFVTISWVLYHRSFLNLVETISV